MPTKKGTNQKSLNQLTNLVNKKNKKKITELLDEMHPADIAEILKNISIQEAQFVYNSIEEEKSAEVLILIDENLREELIADLSAKKIAEDVIENLESDDAVDLISELPEEKQEEVLSHIEDIEYANNLSALLSYPEDTAGGLMAKELIKVNQKWNTLKCLKEMRKQAENVKQVHTIYVVDDNGSIVGTLSLKKLLLTDSNTIVEKITNTEIICVNANEEDKIVADIMNKYNLVVLPVVNEKNILIGKITIDDVIDVVKEEAEKDYQMASGISEDIESSDNILTLTRARLPWLLIGMVGGIFGAKIIGIFDIEKNFELAFFIPLIAAMGGNVGVQSAAIVVQGLANKSLNTNRTIQKLLKELVVSLLNGIVCSIIIFPIIYYLGYGFNVSLTVTTSLLTVIVFAALLGTFTPLTLEKYKIDPALATGPFITTINDILGLFIYFLIGQAII